MKKDFYITLFGGWFGLHKYMNGKIGMGLLYTCTGGLFYIGWIYDCIKAYQASKVPVGKPLSQSDLLRWQNMVMFTNANKLVVSYQQLRAASQIYVEDNLRILNDSLKLVNETTTPRVFFERLDKVFECYNNLADIEEFYSTGISPVTKLQNLDENALCHNFIQRYWYKTVSEAEKLKTERAKENRLEKAKNELLQFSDKMDNLNIQYINQLA